MLTFSPIKVGCFCRKEKHQEPAGTQRSRDSHWSGASRDTGFGHGQAVAGRSGSCWAPDPKCFPNKYIQIWWDISKCHYMSLNVN